MMELETYQDEYLEMDQRRHEVRVDGALVALTITEWNLLAVFVKNTRRIIKPEEFWHILGRRVPYGMGNLIRWHISNLRNKLGFAVNAPIVTVRGIGYRYDAQPVVQGLRG